MSVLSGCYVVKYNHKVMSAGKLPLRAFLCSLEAVKGLYGHGESAGAAAEKRREPGRNGRERRGRGGACGRERLILDAADILQDEHTDIP